MSESFECWAAKEVHGSVQSWAYIPRSIQPYEIDIKIHACGICGSDVHQINSGWDESIYPICPGHEIVGEVTQLGSEVTNFKVGMRVGVGAQRDSCMNCEWCNVGEEHLCQKRVWTYNDRFADGSVAYGGYAKMIRVNQRFAFQIPDNLPTEAVAPLLCAGITVYSPLRTHGVTQGTKLGVIGIGGLGHMALKWGNALGAEVTAISSHSSKEQDARALGAHHFICSSDKQAMRGARRTLDVIVSTVSAPIEWARYFNLVKPNGKFIIVGIPEQPMSFKPDSLTGYQISLVGSVIGSPKMIVEMLKLASEKNVTANVQTWPIEQVNEALAAFSEGKPQYRYVLKIAQ